MTSRGVSSYLIAKPLPLLCTTLNTVNPLPQYTGVPGPDRIVLHLCDICSTSPSESLIALTGTANC